MADRDKSCARGRGRAPGGPPGTVPGHGRSGRVWKLFRPVAGGAVARATTVSLHSAPPLTERSMPPEERRRAILDAAVRVFARKGAHATRVGDIAAEAGVSHGLLYHYFRSKEDVLETIFSETWGRLL